MGVGFGGRGREKLEARDTASDILYAEG